MPKCSGKKNNGEDCNGVAKEGDYCRWHKPKETCIVCLEPFKTGEVPLPCGHWIHRECVQKSSDSLQEIRVGEGHPPLKTCICPMCRQAVPGLSPKDPTTIEIDPPELTAMELQLTDTELADVHEDWEADYRLAPIGWYIWARLCEKYPEYPDDVVLAASGMFEAMILFG